MKRLIFPPASTMCHSRAWSSSCFIESVLGLLEHLPEEGILNRVDRNQVDAPSEEILQVGQKVEIASASLQRVIVPFEFHREIEIARLRIERSLHRRPEQRQPLDVVLL